MNIQLFRPHKVQKQIITSILDPKINFVTVCCGRRLGKTMCNINIATYYALTYSGSKILYLVPSADQKDTVFTEYLNLFEKAPFINKLDKTSSDINLGNNSVIKFRIGGMLRSADNIRGNAFDLIIIDEAALIDQAVWDTILFPTLATAKRTPKVLFTSTPRSKDWFYKQYQYGLDPEKPEYKSIYAPSSSSPFVNLDFLETMRKSLPDRIYRQEILAEFLENSGGLFQNIGLNISNIKHTFNRSEKYFFGIDTGIVNDFSVCIIIDSKGNVVDWLRFQQIEMKEGARRIVELLKKWGSPWGYIETNQYQGFMEMIKELGYRNIESFFTGTNKSELINDLCVEFESGGIKIPNDEYFGSEFYSYTYIYDVKTRNVKFSAPQGLNDDIVMATAIAFKCKKDRKLPTIKTRLIQ
jgi:hypothetical protein